jgi:hypothetical protein
MKPSEFYVGVLDFFAILLPGAILSAILLHYYGDKIVEPLIDRCGGDAKAWVAFLTLSYFIGHLVFLLGSYIDYPYDFFRELFHPYENEIGFQCVKNICDSFVMEGERAMLNPFQWSRSVLVSICPAAAEDVHRLEADSKFFRSALVVCAIVAAILFENGQSGAGVAALILMGPCFARYYDRRIKSTSQAYIHIVTLYRLGRLRL